MNMHLRIITTAALLCLAGASAHAGPQYPYTITDLGTLGGTQSQAYAINSAGDVVGTALTGGNVYAHAFLYTSPGGMQDLGSLANHSWAYAINDARQVVGRTNFPGSDPHAFLWSTSGLSS
jgi:probable HAF family extracellular repeat protein